VFDASRWESLVWPRWLPVRARLPLIAQITGAVALTALIVAPWWSQIPESPVPSSPVMPHSPPVPFVPAVPKAPPATQLDAASQTAVASLRPAHLNLDVRHNFSSVDLAVTVDGKLALNRKLDGSGKRFKMFGKRSERGYTQTLDLSPGVHVVRVRVRSAADKFDQTRTERFELASSSIAAMRIAADKSGMSIAADHPPLPPVPKAPPAAIQAVPSSAAASRAATVVPVAASATDAQSANALINLVQSLRSMLIAIAGFVASAATGFVVQEFLRRRRGLLFAEAANPAAGGPAPERRRRKRGDKTRQPTLG
jgi:hypothetical protein